MPFSSEDRKEYNQKRYYRVKKQMHDFLGGKCSICGSTKSLQIDHKDPDEKEFDVSKCWAYAWETVIEELKKCQLLCQSCHNLKTLDDYNLVNAQQIHGTLSSYRYCKCEQCRKAKSDYMKEYKQRRRSSVW